MFKIKTVVVSFFLVLFSFSSLAQKKNDGVPTSWKTYNNTKLGFTFRYPDSWNLVEDTDVYNRDAYNKEILTGRRIRFIDTTIKTELYIGCALYRGLQAWQFEVTNFDSSFSKWIIVGGEKSIKKNNIGKTDGKGFKLKKADWKRNIDVDFFCKKNSSAMELKFMTPYNKREDKEIYKFNKLLSSFKFIN